MADVVTPSMDASDIDIGVCVPVLNERAVIGSLFDDISCSLAGGRYTICVVDDGSTDGTVELVESARGETPGSP